MPEPVKTRRYDSARRRESAALTRRAILAAATARFTKHGYARTTMAEIAADAGVAVDTIYTVVGTKARLIRLLIESALSGRETEVPARERDYVLEMQRAGRAREKLAVYARAVRQINARLAPVLAVLRQAAHTDAELAELWSEISERRAANMRDLVADLRTTGEVRDDVSVDDLADIVWVTNSPELYDLLIGQRGWTESRLEAFLLDSWCRLLLSESASAEQGRSVGGHPPRAPGSGG